MMAVTMPTGAIDPQNDESNGAEKNNFPDSARHARGNNDPRDNRDPSGGKQQRTTSSPAATSATSMAGSFSTSRSA